MFDSNKLLGNTLRSALCYAPHVMHAKGYRRIEEQAATSMLGSVCTRRANAERYVRVNIAGRLSILNRLRTIPFLQPTGPVR